MLNSFMFADFVVNRHIYNHIGKRWWVLMRLQVNMPKPQTEQASQTGDSLGTFK